MMWRDRIIPALWLSAAMTIPMVGFFATPAHADTLTRVQRAYVDANAGTICDILDRVHTAAGVIAVGNAIVADGFTPVAAVEIVNTSVSESCQRNWALLQMTGAAFRDADTRSA